MNNSLQHFGIPGMKWGVRKARPTSSGGGGGGGTARKVLTKTTDILMGKAGKEAFRKDMEAAKSTVNKILNNKAFKAMIYDKDNGGFIRKDAVKKDLGKAKSGLNSLRDKVNRNQYQTALKELASAKAKGNSALAKELQSEINDLFTPEEKKRYS